MSRSKIKTASITDDAVTGAKIENSPTIATNLSVTGDLTVDTNTLHVDATNNRVGVGLTAPEQPFHVRSSTFAYMRSESTNATYTGLDVGQHQDGYGVINMRDNQDIRFYTNDTERVRVTSDGIDFRNATGTKYVLMKDGDGIHFGASAGSNATTTVLDDYEEGTFTPAYTSGVTGTYQTQFGTYTKVGRLVYVEIHIDGNSMSGNANQLKIGGLPFVSQNANASNGGLYHVYTGGTYDGGNTVTWLINRNEAVVYAYNISGATWKGNQMSDLNGGYRIAGFYQAA